MSQKSSNSNDTSSSTPAPNLKRENAERGHSPLPTKIKCGNGEKWREDDPEYDHASNAWYKAIEALEKMRGEKKECLEEIQRLEKEVKEKQAALDEIKEKRRKEKQEKIQEWVDWMSSIKWESDSDTASSSWSEPEDGYEIGAHHDSNGNSISSSEDDGFYDDSTEEEDK